MERLDPVYQQMQERLKHPGLSSEEREKIEDGVRAREKFLEPMYHQVCNGCDSAVGVAV